MYFRRRYQPGFHSSVRDYYADTAALYRYWRILSSRNRIKRKPLHGYHRSNHNPGTGYDPLLYFTLGYLMAASDRDPVTRHLNGMPPYRPADGQANAPGTMPPLEVRLTHRVVFHGPLNLGGQNSAYTNRQGSY
jgi:hypothetical protein